MGSEYPMGGFDDHLETAFASLEARSRAGNANARNDPSPSTGSP